MVFQKELTLHTHSPGEMHDLTDAVTRIVSERARAPASVQIFNVGSTGAIGAIEFEPGLKQDLPAAFAAPHSAQSGLRPRANLARRQCPFPLQATLLGPSLTVPVRDGKPVLRTWQQIFHIECDVVRVNGPWLSPCWGNDERAPGQRTGNARAAHDRRRRPNRGRYNFRHADDCSNHSGDAHKGIPTLYTHEALVPIARAFCVPLWPATLKPIRRSEFAVDQQGIARRREDDRCCLGDERANARLTHYHGLGMGWIKRSGISL